MNEKIKEILMYLLAGIIAIGFFSVIIFKLYRGLDVQLEVGALIVSFTTVVGYFFGSSKSSQDKNTLLTQKSK